MSNFSVATWNTTDLWSGDPEPFVEFHKSIGAEAILIKAGNKTHPWQGLEHHIAAAKAAGLKIWLWWFYYGHKDEERISADHAEELGADGLGFDIESQWERKVGLPGNVGNKARRVRAEQMVRIVRQRFSGELALCSWWLPGSHDTPVKVFLEGCDYNMPQWYPIGRRTEAQIRDLIDRSLEQYGRMANWLPSKTIPVLASFGQSYKVRINFKYETRWWKITTPLMKYSYELAMARGCQGVSWWSLDYLLGRAGHEHPKQPEPLMIEMIRSFGSAPPPPPEDPRYPEMLRAEGKKIITAANEIKKIAGKLEREG